MVLVLVDSWFFKVNSVGIEVPAALLHRNSCKLWKNVIDNKKQKVRSSLHTVTDSHFHPLHSLTDLNIWKNILIGTVLSDNVMQSSAAPRLTLKLPSSISSGLQCYLATATPISSLGLCLNPAVSPPVHICFPLPNLNATFSLSRHFS